MLIYLTIILFSWGIGNILVKKGLSHLSPWQVYALDAVFIAFPLWMIYGALNGGNLLLISFFPILATLFVSVIYALNYYVITLGNIGLISPIISSNPIITVVLALLFLGEKLNLVSSMGILLTLTGVITLSISGNIKLKPEKWAFLAILVSLGYGISGYLEKISLGQINHATFLMLLSLAQITVIILWKPFYRSKKPLTIKIGPGLIYSVLGIILFNIGNIAYFTALEKGLASVIVPLSNTSVVITVILSVIILKEKIRLHQVIGILLVISGVILVNLNIYKPQFLNNLFSKANKSPPYPTSFESGQNNITPTVTNREKAKVLRVVDGDTVELTDNRRVRYIGINTPELSTKEKEAECFATQAAKVNKELVEGQTVELEKDTNDKDKYNRILRYVWIDDILINEFLVEQGFAKTETIPPDMKYATTFAQKEKEARENGRGLWRECSK